MHAFQLNIYIVHWNVEIIQFAQVDINALAIKHTAELQSMQIIERSISMCPACVASAFTNQIEMMELNE